MTINVYGAKGELTNFKLKPATKKNAFEKDSIERISHDYMNIGKVLFLKIDNTHSPNIN